jgi:hypothetical protein
MNFELIHQIKQAKQKFQKGLSFGFRRRKISRGMFACHFKPISLDRLSDCDHASLKENDQEPSRVFLSETEHLSILPEQLAVETEMIHNDSYLILNESIREIDTVNNSILNQEIEGSDIESKIFDQEPTFKIPTTFIPPEPIPEPTSLHSLLSINDSFDIDLADLSSFLENDISLFQSTSS